MFTASNDSTKYTITFNPEFDCFSTVVEEFDGCSWVTLIDGDIEGDTIGECLEGVAEFLELVDQAA